MNFQNLKGGAASLVSGATGLASGAAAAVTPAAATEQKPSTPKLSLQQRATAKKYVKQAGKKNEKNLPVRLVLCFDGTGDTAEGSFSAKDGAKSGSKDSIYTIYDMTKGGEVVDHNGREFYQYPQYFEGVATINSDKGGMLVQAQALFDGATGNGYLDILREGYKVCCQQLQHDEGPYPMRHELFIFGFSRGAFIARALASFLQHVGLIKEEFLDKDEGDELLRKKFRELLERYMKVTNRSLFGFGKAPPASSERPELLPFCIACPRVRVLGAFDTVKTVIPLPMHNYFKEGIPNIDFQMDAPGIVDHFRHALALNEARPLFNPDLWKQPSDSSDSSYLEAWFFGFHHDIGGGDAVQGLALWPLQWILQASLDNGLVLDPKVSPYEILFGGGQQTFNTPHVLALKMIDMIKYHQESRTMWGLKLNQPFSLMVAQPREWFQVLTKPPYLTFVKPKVFVHPSAYLVFDISSSFRIQVYEWKHFRRFLSDRFEALSRTNPPWWEKQTIDNIIEESHGASQLNILVIGLPKTGKETMVTKIFGVPAESTDRGIASPVKISGNDQIRIYYSNGFGPQSKDSKADVAAFLEKHRTQTDIDERLHAIWYFHDCSKGVVEESEKELFKMDFGDIPVIVVLQNQDTLRATFFGLGEGPNTVQTKIPEAKAPAPTTDPADSKATSAFASAVDKIMLQLPLPKIGKYVNTTNAAKAPKYLLNESACCYEDESVAIAQIKAQRVNVKPKVALAIEECNRAYTIWYIYKTTGQKNQFGRNKNPTGMNLGERLLEVVLNTFSMGFPEDEKYLRTRLGAPWAALDGCKSGLCDDNLSGGLILLCMVDAIITVTYAVWHRAKPKSLKDEALPLTKEDLEKGCQWYTTAPKAGQQSPQQETHRKILELLDEHSKPKDACISNLQMKVIEIVEFAAGNAMAGPGLLSGAKDLVTGVVGGVTGSLAGVVTGQKGFGLFGGGKK